MNHWLILLLTIVAMWAIVLVFMWWWTTENWDWASAELKPPRTVPQEPQLHTHPKPLKAYLDWVDWRGELEQRVKNLDYHLLALEEKRSWVEGAADLVWEVQKTIHLPILGGELSWALRRIRLLEKREGLSEQDVREALGRLEDQPLEAASPSPPTDASITGANWDAAEQESIPPESPASWRSGQTTMTGGPVAPDSEYADPSDAST